MVEVSISLSFLGLLVVGLLGSVSMGVTTGRDVDDLGECQSHTQRVLEEIGGAPFESLLGLDGSYVEDAARRHRARIHAAPAGIGLVQIEVETFSLAAPGISARAVTLISDRS